MQKGNVECLNLNTIMTTYLNRCKMLKTKDNPFSISWTTDFPHIECCIGKCLGLCTIFFKTFTWHLQFMLYYTVI